MSLTVWRYLLNYLAFVAKHCTVTLHHELSGNIILLSSGSRSCNQNMTISTVSLELLIHLQLRLVYNTSYSLLVYKHSIYKSKFLVKSLDCCF